MSNSMDGVMLGRVQCPPQDSEAGYNLRVAFPDFPQVLQGWQSASRELLLKQRPAVDIAYGDQALQNLDFYRAPANNTPLLVFVHGGYWQGGDKADVGFIAAPYIQAGISVAVINYSLAPAARIEDMVVEVRNALRWLRDNAEHLSVNPRRISLMGHSAGGHLVTMMAASDEANDDLPVFEHVFGISGVYDVPPLVPSSINNALGLDAARAEALSPIAKAAPKTTRVHTFVGENETEQFHLQAAALAQSWGQAVVAHYSVPDTHHFTVLDLLGDPASIYSQTVVKAISN